MLRSPATLYTSFYVGQFLFLGVQLPFFPGWLEAEGFTASDIGWIMGGSLILRLLLGPVVAYWAESQTDQRRIFFVVAGVMAISSALLIVEQPLWSIGFFSILAIWAFGCLVPITDTSVMRADKAGFVNYGKARGFGSFAFIAASLGGGVLITRYGDGVSVIWMAVMASLTLVIALALPRQADEKPDSEGRPVAKLAPPDLSETVRLFRSRSFIFMLIAVGMTQGAHATYYYFSELHWSALGYSSGLIGVLWTLGVLAEIVILYLGRRLISRFGPVLLIAAGALGAAIRWPLTGLSPPLEVLIVLQLFHALTFAATYLGSVEFISRAIPSSLTNTGMTIVSTLGVGAITGLGAIFVGLVFSPEAPFIGYALMGVMGAIGFGASILLAHRWDGGIIRSERQI